MARGDRGRDDGVRGSGDGLWSVLFRVVLIVQPRQWRHRYGLEATEAFSSGVSRRNRESGGVAAGWYALRSLADVLAEGWKQRVGRCRVMTWSTGRLDALRVVDTILADVRYALRQIRRAPGFSSGVILTLALGIGANSTMFEIVDRLLLSPPQHVVVPDEVKRIYIRDTFQGRTRRMNLNYPDFIEFQTVNAFSAVGVFSDVSEYTVGSGIGAEKVNGTMASWELFPLLGVTPHIGSFYSAEEDRIGAPVNAVLGYGFWRRRFAGDPSVLGKPLVIGGTSVTIIGVAPQGFTGVGLQRVDIWLPLRSWLTVITPSIQWATSRSWWWLNTVARMNPYASVVNAEEEATVLYRRAEANHRSGDRREPAPRIVLASVVTARRLGVGQELSSGRGEVAEILVATWLAAVSLLVLLIACANVVNLLLARAMDRNREFAVRLAIGASRIRIMRQLFLETLVLSTLGGVAAFAIAHWGGALVQRTLLPDVHWLGAGLEVRVLAFTFVVAILTGLGAGILPCVRASGYSTSRVLGFGPSRGSPGRSPIQRGLLVFQVALSVVLLVFAGLFLKSLDSARGKDLGLQVDRVALVRLEYEEEHSGLAAAEANRRYRMVADRLASLPGVSHSALASVPFGAEYRMPLRVPGAGQIQASPGLGPFFKIVDAEYFPALGIDVLRGRSLTAADQRRGSAPTLLVNETMARTIWPRESALGKCVILDDEESACATVVGVVEDVAEKLTEDPAPMMYYVPPVISRGTSWRKEIYVRFTTDARETLSSIRREVFAAAPGIRFVQVSTLQDILVPQARPWRLGATLFSAFGALALLIAGVGLFSLLAYDVARRTRELGIRTAVGACKGSLVGLLFRNGMRMTVVGLLLGLTVALPVSFLIEPLLFETSSRDLVVYATVVLSLLLVSALASSLPAWKASRLNPVDALRWE